MYNWNQKFPQVELVRSARRTLALEVKADGRVIVRAPRACSKHQIESFVAEHEEWIFKHIEKQKLAQEENAGRRELSEDDIQALANAAKKIIPERVAYYAALVGVDYGRITIRLQKTRWGSCSSKGNLNFNCLLMRTPLEVLDSVVVHELCHRKEMNHSRRFYAEVYRVFPEYDKWNKWLKEHGKNLLRFTKEGGIIPREML